jgi:tetratricopeptide (TPR) repeat protein
MQRRERYAARVTLRVVISILVVLGGCHAPPKTRSEAITLMTRYGKQGKYDDAIRVAQQWLKAHPEDASGGNGIVYEQIAMVYLGKASQDAAHRDEWVQQAIAYFDKDLSVHQWKDIDIEFYSAGRGFEEAGDLSTVNRCLYYGRALKAFADEQPFIQGDTYTDAGTTIPLAPIRLENEKSRQRVQAKFAKADCK